MKKNNLLILAFLFCLVLLPPIKWQFLPFKLQIIDFFMPVFAGIIIYKKWYKNWNLWYVKNFFLLMGIITLSILINKQWKAVNDWFEIYKAIKYLFVFLIFKELNPPFKKNTGIDIIVVCLLIFNFLHYHNLFHFNETVMPVFCGENSVRLARFGLNSAGLPAVKRMIGTIGNPNNNAILFLILMLTYLPKEKWKIKDMGLFTLCLIAFLACQSRTSLVAFFVIIMLHFVIIKIKWQKLLIYCSFITVVMCVFFFTNISSPKSTASDIKISRNLDVSSNYALTLLDGSATKSSSWNLRIKLWKQFLSQIAERPIFGHAPQKNSFYEQKLYFENEYILILWRYGILGFISFIGFYLIPFKKIIKTVRTSEISKNTLLLILIFAICGLSNNPLIHPTLSLLFFSYLGVFYSQKKDNQSVSS